MNILNINISRIAFTKIRNIKKFRRHIYEYSYRNCFENSIYEKS